MTDRGRKTSDQEVVCPRCGGRTQRGTTPLRRVCEDCSRRVLVRPPFPSGSFRDPGTDRPTPPSGTVVLSLFCVLLAVTWAVAADGLSSFDSVVVVATWSTFVVWGLAPSDPAGDDGNLSDRFRG